MIYSGLQFLLSGQRSSYGHHPCVTHLYRIPLWIFDYVLSKNVIVKHFLSEGVNKNLAF